MSAESAREIKIYHNPRCAKSRQTLELLEKKGIKVEIIEYLKNPPSLNELKDLAKKLGLKPIEFMRRKEDEFKKLKLDENDSIACLKAIAKHPVLLERPIVVNGKKAAIGRPPENVLEIF